MNLDDFDFELPPERIARYPADRRDDARLLAVPASGDFRHTTVRELGAEFVAGDVLVLNDTRVIRGAPCGTKDTGGSAEILIERVTGEREALALVRASRSPKAGQQITIGGGAVVTVRGRQDNLFLIEADRPVDALMRDAGALPLPPYLERAAEALDDERYQTVFARHDGAVAAPTAGLHLTDALLEALVELGVRVVCVTLHVGSGTFAPVRVDDVREHRMHAERFQLGSDAADTINAARAAGQRITAVGTTCVRVLESCALADGRLEATAGETDIFIFPGYTFRVVDRLLTNFHLPRSTLLMLVSAFAGRERILEAYAAAIAADYRFFSYGDAMLLERAREV